MFACMFLQLHGDKGVDYCLSDFVFFFFSLCPFALGGAMHALEGAALLGPTCLALCGISQ